MFVAGEALARRTTSSATRPVVAARKGRPRSRKNTEVVGKDGAAAPDRLELQLGKGVSGAGARADSVESGARWGRGEEVGRGGGRRWVAWMKRGDRRRWIARRKVGRGEEGETGTVADGSRTRGDWGGGRKRGDRREVGRGEPGRKKGSGSSAAVKYLSLHSRGIADLSTWQLATFSHFSYHIY
jgi:hypothetical protein